MPKKVEVYNIFIASPSDALEERNVIKNIIYEWNSLNLNSEVRFEPILWESHARPDSGRGQEVINKQLLDKSDIAISIFKTRLGEGTLEEVNLFKNKKKPIMVYFSSESISDEIYNSTEYKDLQKWKQDIAWNEFLADSYSSIIELKDSIFRNLFKLKDSIENDENFILTQELLNYSKKEKLDTYSTNSHYNPNMDRKRLRVQAQESEKFDKNIINHILENFKSDERKIKVLDVGCADGYVTYTRFNYDNMIVLGIDKSEDQVANATEEYSNEAFSFKCIDITEEMDKLDNDYDIIFSSYVLNQVKNSDIIMSKLWDKLNTGGAMFVRTPDDGLLVNYPFDEELDHMIEMGDKIKGSSDRIHGRKLYTFMKRFNPKPKNIDIKYLINDTSNLDFEERSKRFDHLFSFRNGAAVSIAKKTNKEDDKKLAEKLTRIKKEQQERFENSSEIFSTNITINAIAYK